MHEQLTPEQQAAYDRAKADGPYNPAQTRAFGEGPPPDLGLRPRRPTPAIDMEIEPGAPVIDDPTPADLDQPIAGLTCAVSQPTVTALQHVMTTQGVELHEALARLVQIGDVMLRQLSVPNTTAWIVRNPNRQFLDALGVILGHLGADEVRLDHR
jgi:hypothetical protein